MWSSSGIRVADLGEVSLERSLSQWPITYKTFLSKAAKSLFTWWEHKPVYCSSSHTIWRTGSGLSWLGSLSYISINETPLSAEIVHQTPSKRLALSCEASSSRPPYRLIKWAISTASASAGKAVVLSFIVEAEQIKIRSKCLRYVDECAESLEEVDAIYVFLLSIVYSTACKPMWNPLHISFDYFPVPMSQACID